ncbi:MAG: two-component system CheB/CheR fusion protein [Verrucomicrobiales bacterium]|jgi:two-component system CheB/CheR fusion protein
MPKKSAAKRKSPSKKKSAPAKEKPAAAVALGVPVVGLGSSAGGLEALESFFSAMQTNSGLAFVVVTHQHAGHTSLLPELLSERTDMEVAEATNGQLVLPNHVYVAPPAGQLGILNGKLQITELTKKETPSLRIDHFLRSLAEDQKETAVGVILSGSGTDGTLGVKAIKGESGMVMVQEVRTAQYSGMPSSAISTGLADYILPPNEMPRQLLAYVSGPYLKAPEDEVPPDEPLQRVFLLLRARTGHDFSNYKSTTIRRRIERRMNVHQIATTGDYVRYLRENPAEIDLLFKELLISVTSFFRDPQAFQFLSEKPLRERIQQLPDEYTFRVWIPGCATGEEAFTLAILLRELLESEGKHFDVQIFATDLDSEAIDSARAGNYPEGIAGDVTPERLDRFFNRRDSSYQVRKEIREMVIFAPQNVIKDPPFTKLDLISCRNLLIYLNQDLQKRLLPIFHYALKSEGLLLLGPSESVGQFTDSFHLVDKKWKIFRRRDTTASSCFLPEMPAQPVRPIDSGRTRTTVVIPDREIPAIVEKALLSRHCPPSVLVNSRGEFVHIHGRTGEFLEPAGGQPRMNLFDMAREGLQLELAAALRQSTAEGREVVREKISVKTNGGFSLVTVTVSPMVEPESIRGLMLVSFVHVPTPKKKAKGSTGTDPDRVQELEDQLQHSKESLQTTIEELQTSNEELKSANEELQSTNEELQSTNEEMETSKEEMQSLNEELTTVNNELESKMRALSQANDDMLNLLNSTTIATIFLDNDLNIKRFTDEARSLVHLILSDVGRPLADLVSNLVYSELVEDCKGVLKTLAWKETEVETDTGKWYLMRIMPYRTSDNKIDGLVVTFVEISQTRYTRQYFESIVDTMREPLLVLDDELRVVSGNSTFCRTFETSSELIDKKLIYELGDGEWDVPILRKLLEEILPQDQKFEDFRVETEFPDIGKRAFMLNGRKLERAAGLPGMILLAIEEAAE